MSTLAAAPTDVWDTWEPYSRASSPDPVVILEAPLPVGVRGIDAKLSVLRIMTERLLQDRKRALQASAPIKRLPPELLSRMFELAAREHQNLPWRISLVCRSWREVALATPSLWSNISIGHILPLGRLETSWPYNPLLPYRVQTFLDRSRFADLVLKIDISKRDRYPDFATLVQRLEPHIWRCRSFFVWGIDEPGVDVVRSLCAKMLGPGARLRELSLCASSHFPMSNAPSSPLPNHGSMPHLHTLTLDGFRPSCVQVSLPSLRTLRFRTAHRSSGRRRRDDTDCASFLQLLRSLAGLESLEIDSWGFTIPVMDALCFNLLPEKAPHLGVNLKKLALVHGSQHHHLLPLLDAVSFPRLSHLCVCSGEGGPTGVPVLPPFLRNFNGSITLLSIASYTLMGTAVLSLLQAMQSMPLLENLQIAYSSFDSQLFGTLAVRIADGNGGASWLAPRLREISLKHCDGLSLGEFITFARARRTAQDAASITRLASMWCSGADQEMVSQVRELVPQVAFKGW